MLKGAVRSLVRQPAFALAIVGTLALGIAAPTALFSTVNAVLLKPLPYPHAEDIYTVRTYMTNGRFTIGLMASEEMTALQRQSPSIQAMAMGLPAPGAILTDGNARQVMAYGVSGGLFDLFVLPLALGPTVTASDPG